MVYSKLTTEQAKVLNFALSGHNVGIFGKGGVGKSTVVHEIRSELERIGKRCQIVCSSGISCDIYDGLANTVHSYYGLQTAELPPKLLMERSLERRNIFDQIENTEVLIWDEISMSNRRLFNLIHMLHQKTSKNTFPFGGIQIILVGDFWQLKPIQGHVDVGRPIYESKLFKEVFPHRFELTKVLRQDKGESYLKEALDKIRLGKCDDETERYFCSLSRDLASSPEYPAPVHIYFKRLPVDVHNASILATLSGRKLSFESLDSGDARSLEKHVNATIILKPGCKVMLLYNISKLLKNGICGEFVGVDGNNDGVLVDFPKVGVVTIQRRVWYKYDEKGNVQGTRTQFPLSLCYAITAHKSQSLTLDRVVVHCSPEFIPGQTYVAISRVRHEANLRVVGFHKRFLLPPPPQLAELTTTSSGDPEPTFSCCRNIDLADACNSIEQECGGVLDDEENNVDCSASNSIPAYEALAKQHFETNEGASLNLEDVLLCMSDFSHELSRPPSGFSVKNFLEEISENGDPVSQSIKSAANYAYNNMEEFALLACIFWCRIFSLFQDHLTENLEEVHMTNKNFTCATSKVHELFTSNEYRSDVVSAFNGGNWSDINIGQRSLAAKLLFYLYKLFTREVGERVQRQEVEEPVCFKVTEMEAEGKGKIRYIGGWAIRKSLEKSRRYVEGNKMSDTKAVREKVTREMRKINLLENDVLIPFAILNDMTTNPETLNVTESLQFRERGLLHISDDAYNFFMLLEQERVDKINFGRLTSMKNDMVEISIKDVCGSKILRNEFSKLFDLDDPEEQVLVDEIYDEIIIRYMKMGAGQFLRDFRRDYHIKKSLAHRKAVLLRKQTANERRMKVHFHQIAQDKSPGKKRSHTRLLSLVHELTHKGLIRLYSKDELQRLCSAYNVRYFSRWNKEKLATELALAICKCEVMPSHQLMSSYVVEIVENEQPTKISLKIRRV